MNDIIKNNKINVFDATINVRSTPFYEYGREGRNSMVENDVYPSWISSWDGTAFTANSPRNLDTRAGVYIEGLGKVIITSICTSADGSKIEFVGVGPLESCPEITITDPKPKCNSDDIVDDFI